MISKDFWRLLPPAKSHYEMSKHFGGAIAISNTSLPQPVSTRGPGTMLPNPCDHSVVNYPPTYLIVLYNPKRDN